MTTPLPRDALGLVGLFVLSGTTHLVRPAVFEPLVPPALPRPRGIVHVSGVAELACAAGLLHPRTRRVAGLASAALLAAVFPGNVQVTLDALRRVRHRRTARSTAVLVAAVVRLPLQAPMVRAALRAGRA